MTTALEISQLHKVYANGHVALKGINLHVEHGDFFALLGPNGAGKSTTIGIVTSLVNKTGGSISVYGHDIHRNPSQAKTHIGLVPQEYSFNQFEPVEEILINQAGYYGVPPREAKRRAREHLMQLGLWEKRSDQARNLSGGMKRRLMMARALLHRPKLLILDEPTAGVDIEIRRMIWEFLTNLNRRGTTIILTTHYLEEAEKLCRNIAIIDDGQIITDSPMRSLLERLESESFTLYLREPLAEAPALRSAQLRSIDSRTLELVTDKHTDLGEVFSELQAHNIKLLSLRNTSNRLEELFLKLVSSE
ncbi:MAG: ABC transporter ATP-binding protein [Gammaproteobacteria bacterium]|nr:ABC transporter ATP-binding protein [Gammaproteobacteria bacterium]